MDCTTCKEARYCQLMGEISRKRFFGIATGTAVTCQDYAPIWYRGVEGVYSHGY